MSSYDLWRQRLASLATAAAPQKTVRPLGVAARPVSKPEKPPDAAGRAYPLPVAAALPPLPPKAPDAPRSKTVSVRQLRHDAKRELRLNGPAAPLPDTERPKVRGDCEGGDRPCPFVGCRHHTFLDVSRDGSLKFNHGDREPEDVPAEVSCSLDVADRGGVTLEQVGGVLNVTRERMRQLEEKAIDSLKARVFKKQCRVRCAETGFQCGLLEHVAGVAHRHARGEFREAAPEGATTFRRREQLDAAAMQGTGVAHGG